MERHEFIQKIIELYPHTFNEDRVDHVQAWVEMYEKALPKSWDFQKLMWYFATEYKSTTSPPPPSFFYSFANSVRPKEKPQALEPAKPPTPEEEEARKKAMEKFFKNCREMANKMDINKRLI